MFMQGSVGANRFGVGANPTVRADKDGQLVVEMNGRLYENTYNARVFNALGIVTAPVIFSTAAGTGGPLLWNNATTVNCVLLKIGYALTTAATTTVSSLGITGGVGQTAAPTSTTAIDSGPRNNFIGGALPLSTQYRIGTPSNAGNFFIPYASVHLGANTVDTLPGTTFVDLEGSVIVPPQAWVSVGSASATMTAAVFQIAVVWAEVPV